MATGDNNDLLARLKAVLPLWWPQVAPIRNGILSGFAQIGAWGYSLLTYVNAQTRVATASDVFLDLIAYDFFGLRVQRRDSQTDEDFRTTIEGELTRERVTRHGIHQALKDLTGNDAIIFEPGYGFDTGGFDTFGLGFDIGGGWGSRDLSYQMFIRVVEPIGAGVPLVAGYDTSYGAWDGGYSAWTDASSIRGKVTNQDIYDTIEATRAAGITCWVTIGPPLPPPSRLGIDFILGKSQLASSSVLAGVKVGPDI